jgi:hypothetical protein
MFPTKKPLLHEGLLLDKSHKSLLFLYPFNFHPDELKIFVKG